MSAARMPVSGKRRLLVVCHGFPPYYGGAEHVAYYLAREAARSGEWDVEVLTSDIGGRLPASETLDALAIHRIPAPKKEWTRHTSAELARFLWSARRHGRDLVDSIRPDHVLAHFAVPAGAVAHRIARWKGIPYTMVLHGSDVPGYQSARFGLLYPLLRPWFRRICGAAANVVAVSDELKALALQSWPQGRIEVIQNGVDTEIFQSLEKRPSDFSNDWKNASVRLITVAQLIERKGLQHLLEAIGLLPETLRNRIELDICGTGPYESALKMRSDHLGLSAQVRFHGLVKHEQLPDLFRAADAFVLPSLQEGLPLALLEAMASGLPVIATRAGGVPSVLRDGQNGRLVPPADPRALAAALEDLLTHPERMPDLAAAARRTAEEWSWAEVWTHYERLMESAGQGWDTE